MALMADKAFQDKVMAQLHAISQVNDAEIKVVRGKTAGVLNTCVRKS